jgi:DNA-binding XRE family transcriptional regulator
LQKRSIAILNEGHKYYPLHLFLRQSNADQLTLTFANVQSLLNGRLPNGARGNRSWWSNRRSGSAQAAAWLSAGYVVAELDLKNEWVVFRKQGVIPNHQVVRQGGIVLWNGEMVKALREYMGLSQTEFAQELGVRQPTISEWETGVYEPKRSTSKLLALVAERAGFQYE